MARERKSDPRNSRTRRTRRAQTKKNEAAPQVPLQFRAAFANYLMHGMTPTEARLRIAAQIAAAEECAVN